MTAEPTSAVYDDASLTTYIERNPVPDSEGRAPSHVDWVATYDLNRTASEIWEEKAAGLADRYDETSDGATLARSQMQEQAAKMARRFRARSYVRATALRIAPRPEYADEIETE